MNSEKQGTSRSLRTRESASKGLLLFTMNACQFSIIFIV